MKVAILCGGRGMRLNGGVTPKALAEVNDKPMVEHVMDVYGNHDFLLLLGHQGDQVRLRFMLHPRDRVTLADTGKETQTGGRIRQASMLRMGGYFAVAYCDCLADVNIWDVVKFHQGHGRVATLVAVHPTTSYGVLGLDDSCTVTSFREKPKSNEWVNAGFFLFNQRIFSYLDDGPLEDTLEKLATEGQLKAYLHEGFFRCVDTQKDLEELNATEGTPWLR